MSEGKDRACGISPFLVMEVLEKAKQLEAAGRHIVHLEIGEPDFETPEPVKQAALAALQQDDTHYTHSLGKRNLREEISAYYRRLYGVEVDPDQILVTSGTSPAMLLLFSALLSQGDEVVISDPFYACYPNFIRYAGGEPVCVAVREEDGFKYKTADIETRLSPRVKGIMVNSPANPTGNVFSAAELREMAALAGDNRYIISDEIYHGLTYEGKDHSILEFTDRAFVINGFSKKYAMTGWRLGYVIAPPAFVRPMQILQQNLFISACSFIQEAGIAALRDCDAHVAEMVATYDRRRRYLLERLTAMAIAPAVPPTGAFYMLANVKAYTDDCYRFVFDCLEEAGVAVAPGVDFGPNLEGYIRISYSTSIENIREGLDRLERYLQGMKK
jgi:(5-formylfuran-3-yl)methyl phosphate transaminase